MYLWDLGDGRHCWSGWFLSLNLQTLRGRFDCAMAAELVCSWVKDGAERSYRGKANEREDRDIYNLCSRAKWGFDTMFVWKTEIHLNVSWS